MSDDMLFGVLRMPYDIAMSDEISRRQYWQRGQQAADEVERLRETLAKAQAEIERLRADNDLWRQARNDALAGGDALKEELARLRALYEKGVVALVMIERMAAGGIYSQESIHATAVAAIKDLWGEGDGR